MKFYAKFLAVSLVLIGLVWVGYRIGYAHRCEDKFETKYGVSIEQFKEGIEIARELEQERRRAGTFKPDNH